MYDQHPRRRRTVIAVDQIPITSPILIPTPNPNLASLGLGETDARHVLPISISISISPRFRDQPHTRIASPIPEQLPSVAIISVYAGVPMYDTSVQHSGAPYLEK